MVNGMADVRVIDDTKSIQAAESPAGKAFLRIKFEDGKQVDMTLNLAQMIGGAARGASQRLGYEPKDH
jgi:hypothetical protein